MESFFIGIIDKINTGIIIIDSEFNVILWNNWLERYTKRIKTDVVNSSIFDIVPRFSEKTYRFILEAALFKKQSRFCSGSLHKPFIIPYLSENEDIKQNLIIEPISVDDTNYVLIQINDVTGHYNRVSKLKEVVKNLETEYEDIKEAEKISKEKALHDALTGLPNRLLLMDRLDYAVNCAKRNNDVLSVMFLDLDGFKDVNDQYGHQTGDILLKEIAKRLQNSIRKTDTISRISGDEFTFVISDIKAKEDIALIAEKIIACFREPYIIENNKIFLGGSLGISIYPEDSSNIYELINLADKAMYAVKRKGKNNFAFFRNS
jgi:diguanylate cyclase (GGDEF)-like protein